MSAKRNETSSLGHPYDCKQCGKTVLRQSGKRWIQSYCSKTGKNARIWRSLVTDRGGQAQVAS